MSESTDRTKLLQDSTESSDGEDTKLLQAESVPSKDDTATVTVPVSGKEEQKQSSSLDKIEQPPPYEPGTSSLAGVMPQHGSGWMAYASSPYAPTHAQPAPPRPTATHTSIQNQTTVVQVQPYTVSHAQPAPPPTYFGLALFATLCCFWPLGVAALIKSNEVNKHHGMGRYEQARQASEKVRSYSKMSIIIGIILNIVAGVFFGVIVYFRVAAIKSNSYSGNNGYYG